MTKQTAPDEAMRRVADEVRVEMARKRYTAADLAKVLGITPHTAGKRLNGQISFSMLDLFLVANWLEVDLTALIARATQPETAAVAS